MKTQIGLALALPGLLVGLLWLEAAEPAAPAQAPLLVVDGAGKEFKLKSWKIILGTRPLTWLAPPAKAEKDPKDDPKTKPAPKTLQGPEALVFREENSTNFVEGIVTLVPLERIRAIKYDNEGQLVTVSLAAGEKGDGTEELKGTTKYKGINKLTIEAETDLGDLGLALAKFQGGILKGGIRGVTFPAPKPPAEAPAGRPATITTTEKDKAVHKATDLQPLYRLADGSSKPLPLLFFKKTLKVDLAKIQKLRHVDSGDANETEWQVTLKDGAEHTLTLLKTVTLEDNSKAVLEGMLGRVSAGYKLFPVHLIGELQMD